MFLPFNVRVVRWSDLMGEVDCPSFSSLIFMFQPLHHVTFESSPRCSFLRTKPSLHLLHKDMCYQQTVLG
jgi:hypothetical protein